MDKQEIIAIAERAGIAPGNAINVVFSAPHSEPMKRVLTKVEVQSRFGDLWLFWQWKREGQTPWGTSDCGFGGNLIDADFLADLAKASA